jgi:hypothetical protein
LIEASETKTPIDFDGNFCRSSTFSPSSFCKKNFASISIFMRKKNVAIKRKSVEHTVPSEENRIQIPSIDVSEKIKRFTALRRSKYYGIKIYFPSLCCSHSSRPTPDPFADLPIRLSLLGNCVNTFPPMVKEEKKEEALRARKRKFVTFSFEKQDENRD